MNQDFTRQTARELSGKLREFFPDLPPEEELPVGEPFGSASSTSTNLALLIKGLDTSSRDPFLRRISQILGNSYDTSFFSYRFPEHHYIRRDTYKPIPDIAALLTDTIKSYEGLERLCLVGHSLGGLAILHWITREGMQYLNLINRIVLLAAPVWIYLYPMFEFPRHIHFVLERYRFEWSKFRDEVAPKVRVLNLRCEFGRDQFFEDNDLTLARQGFDVEEYGVPGADHFTIATLRSTASAIDNWIKSTG